MTHIDVLQDHKALISEDLTEEIVRQAEERLKMQVQIALAADARSGQAASWQAAGAIALLVASLQSLSGSAQAAAMVAAAILTIAAFCAAVAALPVAFGMLGTLPSGWLDAVRDQESLTEGRAGYAVWLDKYLKLNDQQMAGNNDWLRGSFVAVVLAPVGAFATALIVH